MFLLLLIVQKVNIVSITMDKHVVIFSNVQQLYYKEEKYEFIGSIFNCVQTKVRSIYKWVGDITHPGRGCESRTVDILVQLHLLDVFLKTPFQ